MLRLPKSLRIVASGRWTDFRLNCDRLMQIVRDEWGEDPFSGSLFCFFNRERDRVKLLVWDRNGFWLMHKRLERGRFEQLLCRGRRVVITREYLVMLLSGVDTQTSRFRGDFCRNVRIKPRGRRARSAE